VKRVFQSTVLSITSACFKSRDRNEQSTTTGSWYAKDQLIKSRLSGTAAPPPDLVQCEATGDYLLPGERGQCTVTRQWVAIDRLLKSELSGLAVDRDAAARTDDGRIALPNEIAVCQWTNRRMLPSEVGLCTLSELSVDRRLLNADGELTALRNLLDGSLPGDPLAAQDLAWLRTQPGWNKVSEVRMLRSATTGFAAVVGELRGWFSTSYVGGVVWLVEPRRLHCPALRGRRRGARWFRE
jgi:hypothetical protein